MCPSPMSLRRPPIIPPGSPAPPPHASWQAIIVLMGVVLAALVLLHHFSHHAHRAPVVAVDDMLANSSVVLSQVHRYALLADPSTFGVEHHRNQGILGIGPWVFALGAGLDWLFGTSLALQRAVHPLNVVMVGVAAMVLFWRILPAAGGGIVAGWLSLYYLLQYPMFRADPLLSGLMAWALVAAWRAWREGRPVWWFALGLLVGLAVTNHALGVAFVPWSLLLWGWWSLRGPVGPASRRWTAFAALAAGGGGAALLFLTATRFRLEEYLFLLKEVGASRVPPTLNAALDNLAAHLATGWGRLAPVVPVVMAVTGVVLVWLWWAGRASPSRWSTANALVLPPGLALLAYHATLLAYANQHSGYMIISHLLVVWTLVVLVTVGWLELGRNVTWLQRGWPSWLPTMVAVVLLGGVAIWPLTGTTRYSQQALGSVDFNDYMHQVQDGIPNGSRVWSEILMNLESGVRSDMLPVIIALNLITAFKPANRPAMAPHYVILARAELHRLLFNRVWASTTASPPPGRNQVITMFQGHSLWDLPKLLPDFSLRLVRQVQAPPIGHALVYQLRPNAGAVEELANGSVVRINQGWRDDWQGEFMPLAPPPFFREETPALYQVFEYGQLAIGKPRHTRSLTLPRGTYLIRVRPTGPAADRALGLMTVAPTHQVLAPYYNHSFPLVLVPYDSNERVVELLVEHPGGTLFVSQWDERDFVLESLSRLATSYPDPWEPLPWPEEEWQVQDSRTPLVNKGAGRWEVMAPREKNVDLMGPVIAIPPNRRLVVRVEAYREARDAVVALTDAVTGSFLTHWQESRIPLVYQATAREVTARVRVRGYPVPPRVPAPESTDAPLLILGARGGLVRGESGGSYIDQLMSCLGPKAVVPGDTDRCAMFWDDLLQ